MTVREFRRRHPLLVHFGSQLRLELGLLSAAQVLDRNADSRGQVWARFRGQPAYHQYPVDHWKSHSRFLRGAGEAGSSMHVRDAVDPNQSYFLGSNYPLGSGECIGTTLPLSDNRAGDPPPAREDWFRTLNSMFWVFAAAHVNDGFVDRFRLASGDRVCKVHLATRFLSDDWLENRIRLSKINGGGSNGGFARGTATYKRISEWSGEPPKEIGIVDGVPASLCQELSLAGGLTVDMP